MCVMLNTKDMQSEINHGPSQNFHESFLEHKATLQTVFQNACKSMLTKSLFHVYSNAVRLQLLSSNS